MMLFLPAALGVYMLTNSVLGITQQLAVEKLFPRVGAPPVGPASTEVASRTKRGDIVVKADNAGKATPTPAMRKGKARV
jgi:YidC/Oxa1 family membrane protein insertase